MDPCSSEGSPDDNWMLPPHEKTPQEISSMRGHESEEGGQLMTTEHRKEPLAAQEPSTTGRASPVLPLSPPLLSHHALFSLGPPPFVDSGFSCYSNRAASPASEPHWRHVHCRIHLRLSWCLPRDPHSPREALGPTVGSSHPTPIVSPSWTAHSVPARLNFCPTVLGPFRVTWGKVWC